MNDPTYDLERLISRHLDDECTPGDRRELNARVQHDPHAAALFEDHAALDREVKHALRRALGRSPVYHHPAPLWERSARVLAVAAAACLAAMLWFNPARNAAPSANRASAQPHSWFASPPGAGDTLIKSPGSFSRPRTPVGKPDTEWILIPSDTPGEFLVIEVNRASKRAKSTHEDF